MRIEVAYDMGRVSVTPLDDQSRFEMAQRLIAKSEQTLAQVFLDRGSLNRPLETLKDYFRRRGWCITKEGY